MSSGHWVSLDTHIKSLAACLIDEHEDSGADQDRQIKTSAFRILASAAIEAFVEERCKEVATNAVGRLRSGMDSASGRALVIWFMARKNPRMIPIHEADIPELYDLFEDAGKAYVDVVKATHGMARRDFTNLVYPVGLRESQLPERLLDRLQDLAEKRDPAVHTTRIRVKNNFSPSLLASQVNDIVSDLAVIDELLAEAETTFPYRPAVTVSA